MKNTIVRRTRVITHPRTMARVIQTFWTGFRALGRSAAKNANKAAAMKKYRSDRLATPVEQHPEHHECDGHGEAELAEVRRVALDRTHLFSDDSHPAWLARHSAIPPSLAPVGSGDLS